MKKNTTRRALLLSVLSLIMCASMLIGTTYAWFTDTVASTGNKIQSGTLKIDLELLTKQSDDTYKWESIKDDKKALFNYTLWEPGYTEVKVLKIENEGNLALKWYAKITSDYTLSALADVIDVYVLPGATAYPTDRADLTGWTKVGTVADFTNSIATTTNGTLLPKGETGDAATLGLALKMREEAGNEYQNMSLFTDALDTVGTFDITIFATQYTYEYDSFDNQYDAEAPWTGIAGTVPAEEDGYITIKSAEELAALAADVKGGNSYENKKIRLAADIDLNNIPWTPIGVKGAKFAGSFYGEGHTISNLTVIGDKGVGLFGYVGKYVHIEGVKIDGAYVAGNDYVGAVVGSAYLAANCLKNCTVTNAEIIAMPYLKADGVTYDGGAKAGAIAGYALNGDVSGNTVTNCKITAYRDLGGVAGMVQPDGTSRTLNVTGNFVSGVTLEYVDLNGAPYDSNTPNGNMGNTAGRFDANKVNVSGNDDTTDITRNAVVGYTVDNITYTKDVDANEVKLYLVNSDYEGDTVVVPKGVTNIGNYAFYYNDNVKTVELSSTVTDLGRGFDSSKVEKVVLNEGLTTISSRAFRGTYDLQEVVISSTVKTIADNAFQSSGIKNIVFPANVSYIGDSCFTASTVETVLIEGANVKIAHYAFRDCPNLTKVTILSDTVTLGEGMIFTNSQNNNQNPNNITIYVASEAVKNAIVANGTFKGQLVVMNAVEENGNVSDAFTNGDDTVYLPAGDYKFPASNLSAGDTIICADDVVFTGTSSLNVNGATVIGGTFANESGQAVSGTINGNFKDCVFKGTETLRWCYTKAGDTVVFENCVFETSLRGIHFDEMNGNVIFRNCEINGFNAYSGTGTMTFENCTFGYDKSRYNGLNMYTDTNLINCTFNYLSGKSDFIDFEKAGRTLTVTNCTATQDGEEIDIFSKIGGSKLAECKVIIDGAQVVFNSDALKAAIESKATKILLANGDYSVRFTNHTSFNVDGMTIVGLGDAVKLSVSSSEAWYGRIQGDNVTFENITFTGQIGATGKATYNNCNITYLECASSGNRETFVNDCTLGQIHTSGDFSAGNAYVKNTTITKAEYSGSATMYFENCTIGELISWNMNTVLTNCTVTTLDDSHMTSGSITIN